MSPPGARMFYVVLVHGLLDALAAEGPGAAEFSDHLRSFWPGLEVSRLFFEGRRRYDEDSAAKNGKVEARSQARTGLIGLAGADRRSTPGFFTIWPPRSTHSMPAENWPGLDGRSVDAPVRGRRW